MHDTTHSVSRRQALGLLGGAGAVAAIPLLGVSPAEAATEPAFRPQPGGSGVSGTSNQSFFTDGTAKVITAVSSTPGPNGKRTSTYVKEQAIWSGVRDLVHPYGFAAFTVDPGRHPGDMTRLQVTYYNVNKPHGELLVFETFILQRRRSDGRR